MLKRFSKWRKMRKTKLELSNLSDVMLKDIGINRSEINYIAHCV